MSDMFATRRALMPLAIIMPILNGWCLASASPGSAFVALSPAPGPGDFDVATYCTDAAGFADLSGEYPDGWSVAYRSTTPPPGWNRPFTIRGGGPASSGGELHPRFSYAVDEMLPVRASGVMTLLHATDPDACYPGKPNPQPFHREGLLFVHDGVIDIEPITTDVWLDNQDPGWEAFKLLHPRDYNGNGESTRGNASEIYFLALLYEIQTTPDDIPGSFRRLLDLMCAVPGYAGWQFNAILQKAECTWVLRHVLSGDPDTYRIYYGLTTDGEYCITDHLPATGTGWIEMPNLTLGVFPAGEAPEFISMLNSSAETDPRPGDRASSMTLSLEPIRSPARGRVELSYRIPPGSPGSLQIWDLEGRSLARLTLRAGSGTVQWDPPPELRSGLLMTRLCWEGAAQHRRVLFLR